MSTYPTRSFRPELAARFDRLVTIYPLRRSALVPMLLYAQDEMGYVSDAVIAEIAQRIGITRAGCAQRAELLLDAAHQAARASITCRSAPTSSCMLRGGERDSRPLQGSSALATSRRLPDGVFSLEEVECIGACCWAPAMQVNYDFHDNVTPDEAGQDPRELPAQPEAKRS